jgi:hypothetical protein
VFVLLLGFSYRITFDLLSLVELVSIIDLELLPSTVCGAIDVVRCMCLKAVNLLCAESSWPASPLCLDGSWFLCSWPWTGS